MISYFDKMNSILGSVVPLAMFILLLREGKPSWHVLFPYGHYPNSFRPTRPLSNGQAWKKSAPNHPGKPLPPPPLPFGQCPWKQHISNRGFPIMQYSETKTENQGLASSFRNIIYRNLYFIVKVQIVLIQGQSHLDEQTGICAFTNDLWDILKSSV